MPRYDFSQPHARQRSWKWSVENVVDGYPVLPMSVADTDFISPHEVTETLREIADNAQFGYATVPDDQCEVIAAWQKNQHGWDVSADHLVIANGLLASLALMLDKVTAPGDGVIVFSPVYHNFYDAISGVGRLPQVCELRCDDDARWQIDFEQFQALCEQAGNRAVVICNPHNPVGRAWTADELVTLIDIARQHDVIVFSDEVHADFTYDQPFVPAIQAARDGTGIMTISSGGKLFNLGGLFTSYAISEDPVLRNHLLDSLHGLHWEQNSFGAWAAWAAYRHGYDYRDEVVAYVRQMQCRMADALNAMPYPVSARLPEATYLLWADFRDSGWSPDELQRFLVQEAGLGFNRGDSFGPGGAGFMRINCAVPESRIDEAIRRLTSAFETLDLSAS